MKKIQLLKYIKGRYVDPQYIFRDRLYFWFGTAGLFSAGAAFAAAVFSGLPWIAAAASLFSFFIMLVLMTVSFFMQKISINRIVCSIFLNFFMFPVLFWVTGGVDCGMSFYFILGLSVAALILDGKIRSVVLTLALIYDSLCLYLGFRYPELASPLSYEERSMDVLSSFIIVSLFIITVIIVILIEYQKEHDKVLESAASLQRQALSDNLTTLYNQRYLTGALKNVTESCQENGSRATLVMLDIDDFKKVNDTYGHLRGNQVLCQFAALLKSRSEEGIIAARFGGEEFILVLPGMEREEGIWVAEQVRLDALKNKELQALTGGKFSISGGVAEYEPDMSVDEWVHLSDENLYTAKARGKNQIVG